ncbi:glycosyl-4,4'-diaponeurosporenoate acyltransferase CrtO family protein [Dermatobacter hominis]|uniref:glycosyl-4,4'-diaponeurosporenoate acyltransferase CrtO family protein n=1 Tax=Dermatobacter hominis TaxID=2884263 RepID=UPI001D10F49C|nr:hypothetical protein [Dermatobacter hominis]UDY36052.1 hypothetical protein LH044_00600 [Dermatobacter hominis]
MALPLDDIAAVLVSCAAWAVIGVVTGFVGNRLPERRIDHDTWLTRPRRIERDGRLYQRTLRINRWKDTLPEGGAIFAGGTSKRHLGGSSDADLLRFAAETRRAELVHWANLAAGPLFLIWCPLRLGVAMVAFGVVAHSPFICIQRSNRLRIGRILRCRADRPGRAARSADRASDRRSQPKEPT